MPQQITVLLPAFQNFSLENIPKGLNGFHINFSTEFLDKIWQKSKFIKNLSSSDQEIKKVIFSEYFFLEHFDLKNKFKVNPFSLEEFWKKFCSISMPGPVWNNLSYGQNNFFYLSTNNDSSVSLIVCIKRIDVTMYFSCLEHNNRSRVCFGDQLFF